MRILILANLLIAAALAQTTPPPAAKKTAPAAKPAAAKPAAAKPAPAKPAAAANANDPVVLTVGDQKMTKSQFETLVAALPEQMRAGATGPNKRKFAEQLTDMKAMAYEAKRRKIDQKPETKQLIALQADNLLASELFKSLSGSLKVDNAAMQSYYDQHKGEFEQVKARHILIRFKDSAAPLKPGQKDLTDAEALAKAKDLREKIVKGGDFAAIAKAESDDTGSGANGGELGNFGHGQMVPEFDKAAFSLKPGDVSEPVRSQFGYHIIKVEAHTSKSLEEVKPQIEAKLKPELAKKAVDEVKKTVPVTISDEYFGK